MPAASRPLGFALVATLLLALLALGFARYLGAPAWVDALWACAALCGLATALAFALVLSRLSPASWYVISAGGLAAASAATRWLVIKTIAGHGEGPVQIDLIQIWLAASSIVWGGLGLYWAVKTVSDAMENPDYERMESVVRAAVGGCAVSLSLYSLAPLWLLLGLQLNIWTVLGLVGLALSAYLLEIAQRHIGHRIRRSRLQ